MVKRLSFFVISFSLFTISFSLSAATGNLDGEIGAESARAVEAQMGLYDQPRLLEYVTAVGTRLTDALSDDRFTFRFFLVDDAVPNAFALPGGYVYVTRGLLVLLQTEDELAGVMAHEIIHVAERHGVRRGRRGLLGGLLEVPGRIVGGLVDPRVGALINAPISGANQLVLASYSRGQEKSADKRGIELVARAGYDPTHMGRILVRLAAAVEVVTGKGEGRNPLREHPITADRLSYLNRLAPDLEREAGDPVADDLFALLEGLPVGENPDHGIFVDNTFLHPGLDLALVFPPDWQTFNAPIAVGAVASANDGALFYSLEDSAKAPSALANEFVADLPVEYRDLLTRSEPVTVNEIPAYVVTLAQNPRSGQRIYLHMAWAAFDDFTLRLAAYGGEAMQQTLRTSARSFRRLTASDRAGIERRQIGIATAQEGEAIGAFSKRVGNHWSDELTRVVNDVEGDALPGRRQKILEVTPFHFQRSRSGHRSTRSGGPRGTIPRKNLLTVCSAFLPQSGVLGRFPPAYGKFTRRQSFWQQSSR